MSDKSLLRHRSISRDACRKYESDIRTITAGHPLSRHIGGIAGVSAIHPAVPFADEKLGDETRTRRRGHALLGLRHFERLVLDRLAAQEEYPSIPIALSSHRFPFRALSTPPIYIVRHVSYNRVYVVFRGDPRKPVRYRPRSSTRCTRSLPRAP